jgi:hypothetical protein
MNMKTNLLFLALFAVPGFTVNAQQKSAGPVVISSNTQTNNAAYAGPTTVVREFSAADRNIQPAVTSSNANAGNTYSVPQTMNQSYVPVPIHKGKSQKRHTNAELQTASRNDKMLDADAGGNSEGSGGGLVIFNNKKADVKHFPTNTVMPGVCYNRDMRACHMRGFGGLYGVQIGMYTDLSRCKKDLIRYEKKYKIIAYLLQDIRDDNGIYRLIIGRYMHLKNAKRLMNFLWRDFPGCFVVRFNHDRNNRINLYY